MELPERAAVIGCGVIGSGWVARLRLCGVDVSIADPAPDAERIAAEVMANATAAWQLLGLPTDDVGEVSIASSVEEAVEGAGFIQEAVPERLEIKQAVFQRAEQAAGDDIVIASATSGFKPTNLQSEMTTPHRLVVGHPFNPVYLLPLVEVVGGEATEPAAIEGAMSFYEALGMRPLHVRVEIDAFIADRLLEAVWREAMWLVNDGVATTGEIDDAIKYGFGLRWAQMGMYETYRVAGGEAGMRHFIAQFGEALNWPWTKLMDTPELSDELVERIAAQSDDQAAGRSVRELEQIRDRNLASILLALEENACGAGEVLARHRAAMDGTESD